MLLDPVPLLRMQKWIVGCEQSSAVDIGSLTHRFLRLIDLATFRGRLVDIRICTDRGR